MSKKPEFADLFFSKTKDFLDIFFKSQEQRSADTIKAYRISLSSFYKYVTEVKEMKVMHFCFSDCTYEFVLSYSQYLQEAQKLANSTVNQRLAALKSYLKYVSDGDIGLMQIYMAVQKVPLLKTPKLQRPVIEKEDLKAFLAEPENTKIGRRDRVLLALLYDTAVLRRSRAPGLYRDGVPLELVSAILGHASSETTKIYAIPSVEQMREAPSKGQPDEAENEKIWEGKEAEIRRSFGLE